MKLCLDEMYAPQIAGQLRERAHDVISVKERAEWVGMSDSDLLAQMRDEERALLTENVADFGPLVKYTAALGESHAGIIYSSNASMPRSAGTIGRFVAALEALLNHYGDQGMSNRVEWI